MTELLTMLTTPDSTAVLPPSDRGYPLLSPCQR